MQEAQLTTVAPVAPEPRDRRALCALKHGLTGQVYLLTQADQVAYDKHCHGIHESLAPVGALENTLVESIADDRWRLKRAAAIESAIFADGLTQPDHLVSGDAEIDATLAHGRIWKSSGRSLELLTLYENRIHRHAERNMAELRRLQAERKAALDQAVEEAELLAQLAESKGEAFALERDFPIEARFSNFVFSISDIARQFDRRRRVTHAKKLFAIPRRPAA